MLKWMGEEAHAWMSNIFSYVLQHDMPCDWIKPLHKGGDVNNVNNYQDIMVASLMTTIWIYYGIKDECMGRKR